MKPEGWVVIVLGTLAAGLISVGYLGAMGRLAPGQTGGTSLVLVLVAVAAIGALLFSPEARARRARRRRR
ncbi:hypothetical protein [Microbacterium gilvum]|uniref:Uncharacterized protein n=1 Tax=Microbacterium gilvum TaxID=1336204 RepID=A0ABP8ZSP3_9MICO